jgi:hypothetical protein
MKKSKRARLKVGVSRNPASTGPSFSPPAIIQRRGGNTRLAARRQATAQGLEMDGVAACLADVVCCHTALNRGRHVGR